MPYRNEVRLLGHLESVEQRGDWLDVLFRTKANYKPKDGEAADVIIPLSASAKYNAKLLDCHPGALLLIDGEMRGREYNGRFYASVNINRFEVLWNTKPKAQQEPPPSRYASEDRPPPLPPQPELPKQDNEDQIPF